MTRGFESVLRELRDRILRVGGLAEAILLKSVRALEEGSVELAREVARDDLEIDRLDVEIDHSVLEALALNAPVAGDLREVIASKMIATDLERVGDLARNIAKSAARVAEGAVADVPVALSSLARLASAQLRAALDAYARADAQAAQAVLEQDDRVDEEQDTVILEALRSITAHPDRASHSVDIILVAKHLERVGDHATNIAEDVILVVEARNVKHAAKLSSAPSS